MNLNEKPVREKYKEFLGKMTEQMELIIKDKREPMTIKQIIERRLNSEQKDWKDNYFDTCDAIAYGKNGNFKIIKNCDILKNINSKTKLEKGRIKLNNKEYENLEGQEFDEKTCKEVIWKYLLEELYEPYIKMINYCPNYYISFNEDTLGAWYVGRLDGNLGSSAYDWGRLDVDYGCSVGVASEMQE